MRLELKYLEESCQECVCILMPQTALEEEQEGRKPSLTTDDARGVGGAVTVTTQRQR